MESCCASARRFAFTTLTVGLIAVGAGCSQSGQTGSPADIPTYDSFTNFGADSGGVIDTDGEMAGPCFDSNSPLWSRSPNDFVKVVGNHLVMVVEQLLPPPYLVPPPAHYRGLLKVFDVSAAGDPQLVGELAFDGQPLALEVADGVATVVMHQMNEVESDQIPTERVPYESVRLIRVDWSDPAAPTRVADVPLSGDFWAMHTIGDRYYVLSSRWEPTEPVCSQGGGGLLYTDIGESCPVGSLQVAAYSFDGSGFVQDEQQDIGGDGYTGFVAQGSFAAVAGTGELEQTLSATWVDAEDGALRVSGSASVDGMVRSVSLSDGVLAALVTPASGADELRLYAVSDGQVPTELGSVAVAATPSRISFQPGGGALLLEGISDPGNSVLVDVSDPSAPALTTLSGAREAIWLGDVVLGLGASDTGRIVATLWDTSDLSAPVQLDQVESNVPYTSGNYWSLPPWTAQPDTGLVLYPSSAWTDSGDLVNQLLVVRAEVGALAVLAEPQTSTWSPRPSIHGQTAYSTRDGVLEVIPLTQGSTPHTIDLFPDRDRWVLSEKEVGSGVARLVREGEDVVVEIETEAAEPSRFVLEHFAEELYVDGERVVALGLRRGWDCDLLAEMPDNPDLVYACPTPNQAGITVISVGDEPRIEASILISSDLIDLPELPPDASAGSEWYGYLPLGDGRLILPVSLVIRCESSAACAELGIQAYEGMATPGCEGGDADCSSQPAVIVTNSGSEWQKWVYVLDLDGDDGPELLPGVRLQDDAAGGYDRFELSGGEGPLDLAADVLVSGSTLGFPSLEHRYDASGNPIRNDQGDELVRHWIHLVSVDPDAPIEWVGSVNIPGRALALRHQGNTVFSVAPEYADDTSIRAVLYRAEIRDGGAYVDQTLSLGVGYRDGFAIGGRGYFIRGPEDRCEEDPTDEVFSVRLGNGDLSADPALELPGDNWSFARFDWPWDEGTVLLRGGPADYRGRLSLDVSEAGSAPSVIRYSTTPQ